MIEIESLRDYINKDEFKKLVKSIYKITSFITKDYPDYKDWFFKKQLDGVLKEERNILFVRNPLNSKEIIAVASLKKSKNEKKNSEKYRVGNSDMYVFISCCRSGCLNISNAKFRV